MTNKTKMLPGMVDEGIEFFIDEGRVKTLSSGKVNDFTDLPFSTIQILKDEINRDQEVKAHLLDMHPNSEFKRIEQFVMCRFGGLDYQADISANGVQSGEYWDCPLRGKCDSEGVLCRALTINGNVIDEKDIELARRLATDETNELIASNMDLPMGSFHLRKKKLYKKMGVRTKQELTILSHRHNII